MAAWYYGKFAVGFTGMLYVYLKYIQKKDTSCICALLKQNLLCESNVEFCAARRSSDVTVNKECEIADHPPVAVLDQSLQTQVESVSATTMTTTPANHPQVNADPQRQAPESQPPAAKPVVPPKPQTPAAKPVPPKPHTPPNPPGQIVPQDRNANPPSPHVVVPVELCVSLEKVVESVEVVIKKQIEHHAKRPRCGCNKLQAKRRKRKSATTSLENGSVCRDVGIERMEQDFRRALMDLDKLDRTFSAVPRRLGTNDKSRRKSETKNHTQPIAWWHTKASSCSNTSEIFSSTKVPNTVKYYSSRNYSIRRSNHDRQVRQAC